MFTQQQNSSLVKSEIKTFLDLNDNGEVHPNIIWDTLKAVIQGKTAIHWRSYYECKGE